MSFLERQKFNPTLLGALFNPYFSIRRRLRASIAERAPLLGGRILDFGSGQKPYRDCFTAASEYVGVDVEVSGHSHELSQVDVYYDGKTLPFPDGSFDHAFASEVFEHLFNLSEMLTELHRVLKPGSTLLISIPFAFPEHEVPYDFARYTRYGITSLLQDAGFTVTEIKPLGNFVLAIGQLAATYLFQSTPSSAILRAIVQALLIAPVTLISELASRLLPHSETFYCGLVVQAKR